MGIDLPLLWAVIILFGVMMYVVMDGFDLGIGLLFPFFRAKDDRDVMMNTVAPVWDGNETWLVLGGAGLLAAFPTAYAVVLSAFYLPIIGMLVGLIFRGVAFEFRFKATPGHRAWWDTAFIGGSLLATFSQGVVLGGYIGGLRVEGGRYVGDGLDWLTPFALFTGAGLLATYALLGATWLVMKTDGLLQLRMRLVARTLAWVLLLFIAAISLWTPLAHERVAERWFSLAQHRLVRAGAGARAGGDDRPGALARHGQRGAQRRRAVRLDAAARLSRLQRPGHQPMAAHRAARTDDPRRGGAAAEHGFRARRRAVRHPADPDVHGLGLLGVSRQGARRRWLPLMQVRPHRPSQRWLLRLAWLGLFWIAGVASMGIVAMLLRALMRAVGLA